MPNFVVTFYRKECEALLLHMVNFTLLFMCIRNERVLHLKIMVSKLLFKWNEGQLGCPFIFALHIAAQEDSTYSLYSQNFSTRT